MRPGSVGASSPRTRPSPSSARASASPSSARAPRRCASSATRSAASSSPRRSACPVAPWSRGGVDTLEDAKAAAARIGYPLMLKATAGGGGRGIRRVDSDADLTDAYERTRDEAQRAFGSGVVFLEKLVTGARHIEVQVIADGQGTAWAVGVRDCSVQRRNQKVIEESSSPVLGPEQEQEVRTSAERLAIAVGYAGAGTVEFLYHPGEQFFAFLEVNTRLQVEHPITEVVTDTDLVKLQIHVADGGRLDDLPDGRPTERGHAVEARLNAEDPDRDFAPSPGPHRAAELPLRARHPGRHRCGRGRLDPRRLRLDDRQDHRPRPRPRRGPGPPAPRALRDDRRHRRRLDQQELHPRPARPARDHRRLGRHRLDRPGALRGPARLGPALRHRPRRRRHRGLRGRRGHRARSPLRVRPRRTSPGAARRGPRHRPQAARHGIQGHGAAHGVRPLPRLDPERRRRPRRRRLARPHRRPRGADHRRGPRPPPHHRHPRTRAPRRGRRHHPPRLARRGWRRALARPGPRRCDPRAGRGGGRGGRPRARARVDEDGDRAAVSLRGAGARAARGGRQPGRDRRPARAARADGRRGRGRRDGCRRETVDLDLPDSGAQSATARERADRGIGDLSAAVLGFDGDPADDRRQLSVLPRRPRRARRRGAGAASARRSPCSSSSPTSPS